MKLRPLQLLLLLSAACCMLTATLTAAAHEVGTDDVVEAPGPAAAHVQDAALHAKVSDVIDARLWSKKQRQAALSSLLRSKNARQKGRPAATQAHPRLSGVQSSPGNPSARLMHKFDKSSVDACKRYPCMNNENSAAVCKDKGGDAPDSPDGRTCSCVTPNHIYQDDLLGCLDVDACKKHPCAKGEVSAVCKDLPGAAADSPAGRTCSCPAGYTYINDLSGCVDVFLCIENHWSAKCKSPCSEAPELHHGAFPSSCSGSAVSKDFTCSGSCDKGWQPTTSAAPTATCTSAGWVVEGACESVEGEEEEEEQEGSYTKQTDKPKAPAGDFFEGVLPGTPSHDSDSEHQHKQSRKHRHKQHKQHKHDKRERHSAKQGAEEELELLLSKEPHVKQQLLQKKAQQEGLHKAHQHQQELKQKPKQHQEQETGDEQEEEQEEEQEDGSSKGEKKQHHKQHQQDKQKQASGSVDSKVYHKQSPEKRQASEEQEAEVEYEYIEEEVEVDAESGEEAADEDSGAQEADKPTDAPSTSKGQHKAPSSSHSSTKKGAAAKKKAAEELVHGAAASKAQQEAERQAAADKAAASIKHGPEAKHEPAAKPKEQEAPPKQQQQQQQQQHSAQKHSSFKEAHAGDAETKQPQQQVPSSQQHHHQQQQQQQPSAPGKAAEHEPERPASATGKEQHADKHADEAPTKQQQQPEQPQHHAKRKKAAGAKQEQQLQSSKPEEEQQPAPATEQEDASKEPAADALKQPEEKAAPAPAPATHASEPKAPQPPQQQPQQRADDLADDSDNADSERARAEARAEAEAEEDSDDDEDDSDDEDEEDEERPPHRAARKHRQPRPWAASSGHDPVQQQQQPQPPPQQQQQQQQQPPTMAARPSTPLQPSAPAAAPAAAGHAAPQPLTPQQQEEQLQQRIQQLQALQEQLQQRVAAVDDEEQLLHVAKPNHQPQPQQKQQKTESQEQQEQLNHQLMQGLLLVDPAARVPELDALLPGMGGMPGGMGLPGMGMLQQRDGHSGGQEAEEQHQPFKIVPALKEVLIVKDAQPGRASKLHILRDEAAEEAPQQTSEREALPAPQRPQQQQLDAGRGAATDMPKGLAGTGLNPIAQAPAPAAAVKKAQDGSSTKPADEPRSASRNAFDPSQPQEGMLQLLLKFGVGHGNERLTEEQLQLMAAMTSPLLGSMPFGAAGPKLDGLDAAGAAAQQAQLQAAAPAAPAQQNNEPWEEDDDEEEEEEEEEGSQKGQTGPAAKKATANPPAQQPAVSEAVADGVRRVMGKIAAGLMDARSAASGAAPPTSTPSPTAQAVSKSWSRSLLGTNFGGFGDLFADPAPAPSPAAAVDAATLDIPDLGAISSLLDKLEGKASATAAAAPAKAAGSPTLYTAAASSRALSDISQLPVGSYRQEESWEEALGATTTTVGSQQSLLTDPSASLLSSDAQRIRRHKYTQEPQEDPQQYTAYAPAPKYAPTPSQYQQGQSKRGGLQKPDLDLDGLGGLGGDGSYAPARGSYRGVAPPPVQYAEPAPADYPGLAPPPQQQYSYAPTPRQKVQPAPGGPPEYEGPQEPSPDAYSSYQPKRLQRSWSRSSPQYPDNSQGPEPSGPGPFQGGLGGSSKYADDASSLLDGAAGGSGMWGQDPSMGPPAHQQQQGPGGRMSRGGGFEDMRQAMDAPEQHRLQPGMEGGDMMGPQPRASAQPGSSGPALVLVTNTAREKAGSITVCQWDNGQLGSCMISMIPMFKVNGKNSYPQPTGLAAQRDASGRVKVWVVDGTRNPAVICDLLGLEVTNCVEHKFKGYSDGLFDARQVAVAGNVAFVLAWDKACVVQCLDAKGLSQCSCILGHEFHGIYPVGLTVAGNKLYVSHNTGTMAGVMTCDFGPTGVNECMRSPDLPLNVDGGMLVHEGRLYMSYTDYAAPDLSERGGIIVCDNAEHIRANNCRYSTGKVPARGGILSLAVHDGVMFVPQHVRSQEVSLCMEVTDTDVTGCSSVHTKDTDDRVAFRHPTAIAVLPVPPGHAMPQPPAPPEEEGSKIDLLKNYRRR